MSDIVTTNPTRKIHSAYNDNIFTTICDNSVGSKSLTITGAVPGGAAGQVYCQTTRDGEDNREEGQDENQEGQSRKEINEKNGPKG